MLYRTLIWTADRLAALSEWLCSLADEHRPEWALSLDEIDEIYERQAWWWRVNRGSHGGSAVHPLSVEYSHPSR